MIAKKKVVNLTVSLGADPKTKLSYLIFQKLSLAQARVFIKKEKLPIQSFSWIIQKRSQQIAISNKNLRINRSPLEISREKTT